MLDVLVYWKYVFARVVTLMKLVETFGCVGVGTTFLLCRFLVNSSIKLYTLLVHATVIFYFIGIIYLYFSISIYNSIIYLVFYYLMFYIHL